MTDPDRPGMPVDPPRDGGRAGWREGLHWLVRHRVGVCVAVVATHAVLAAVLGRLGAPIQGDERDYLAGAARLWDGGAYHWGYRPPLVSLAFAPAGLFEGPAALALARIVSLTFGACSVAWWLRAAARAKPGFAEAPALTALLVAAWPPFFAFSSQALGEGLALFAVSGVLASSYLLVHAPDGALRPRRAAGTGLLLGVAVLTKANLGVLAVTWAAWVFGLRARPLGLRVRTVLVAAAAAAAVYAPWATFQLVVNDTLSPTTSGGMNLAVGAGAYGFGMDSETESVVARYRHRVGWDTAECRGDAALCARIVAADHPGDVHAESGALARAHWRSQPARSAGFVVVKWAHMLGLSLRGPTDYALVLFGIAGLAAAVLAWRRGHRAVVGLLACTYAAALLTAAAFLPNIRLRTPVIDPANLLVLAVAWTATHGRADRTHSRPAAVALATRKTAC